MSDWTLFMLGFLVGVWTVLVASAWLRARDEAEERRRDDEFRLDRLGRRVNRLEEQMLDKADRPDV